MPNTRQRPTRSSDIPATGCGIWPFHARSHWHMIRMATGMLHVAALAAALMAFPPTASTRDFVHIRTTSPLLSSLVLDAREHSPTFVGLIARLERSDVIVYLEPTPNMESRF